MGYRLNMAAYGYDVLREDCQRKCACTTYEVKLAFATDATMLHANATRHGGQPTNDSRSSTALVITDRRRREFAG